MDQYFPPFMYYTRSRSRHRGAYEKAKKDQDAAFQLLLELLGT